MLDRDSLTTEEQQFYDAVVASGYFASTDEFEAKVQELAEAAGISIANSSSYSAFWAFVKATLSETATELMSTLVTDTLPNLYLATASGDGLELLAEKFDIYREEATFAVGNLVFSRSNSVTTEVVIPAGTLVKSTLLNGVSYRLVTLEEATTVNGYAVVQAQAEFAGAGYNLGAGYYCILDSSVTNISSVTNSSDWLLVAGSDAESDDELRSRVKDSFMAVGGWYTDAKYRAIIADYLNVDSANIYFDHETERGAGCCDCYVIFETSVTPTEQLAGVNSYITDEGNHGHGDSLIVYSMVQESHDLECSVVFDSTLSSDEKSAILDEISERIKYVFWQNSAYDDMSRALPQSRFSFSNLAYELHKSVSGFTSISFSLADFSSDLVLPVLGDFEVVADE